MNENKIGVALVKEICPVCAKKHDGPIVLNTRLTEQDAKNVESMHGKVIGMAEKPCKECSEFMEMGVIFIGVDVEKTEDKSNPYRSGHFSVLSEEFMKRNKMDMNKRVYFMDYKEGIDLGIFKQNKNETNN